MLYAWLVVAAHAAPGAEDCFARLDYADELVVDADQVAVTREDLSDRVVRLTVTGLALENLTVAQFTRAEVTPVLEPWTTSPPQVEPVSFPALSEHAVGAPLDSLVVDVDPQDEAAVTHQLLTGGMDYEVHAAEVPVLRAGVEVASWTDALDDAHALAGRLDPKVNPDPGPGPWAVGTTFELSFAYDDVEDVPAILADFQSGDLTFMDPDQVVLTSVPEALHHISLVDVDLDDTGPTTWVTVDVRLSDEADPRDIYRSATLCTRTAVDHPVRETRVLQVNGTKREPDDREMRTAPVWFENRELFDGKVTISGQVHAQAVVPVLVIRIRSGALEVEAGIVSEVGVTAQLQILDTLEDERQDSLGRICFPLPDIDLGLGVAEQLLCVEPTLFANLQLRAGVTVAVTERIEVGATVVCRWPPGDPVSCVTKDRLIPEEVRTPSPPEIEEEQQGTAEWGVRFDHLWVLQSRVQPPVLVVEAAVGTEMYGVFDVTPLDTPAWTLGHGTRLVGSVSLEVFGEEGITHPFPIFEPPPTIDRQAPPPARRSGTLVRRYVSGEDLRWLVAIDDAGQTDERPEDVDLAVLSDGGSVLTAVQGQAHRVVAVDRYGALRWSQRYASGFPPAGVVALPDDSVVTAGTRFAAAHDPDGSLRWATSYDVTTASEETGPCTIRGLAHVPADTGEGHVVLVGELFHGQVREADACVIVIDASDGSVVWSAGYHGPGRQLLLGAVTARDGDLVVVGTDELDGWMMRLDPDTGDVRWSVVARTAGSRGGELYDVAEGADGRLVAVGSAGREIRHTGSGYVMSADAHGGNVVNGLLFHDPAGSPDAHAEPMVVSSDTPLDRLRQVVAVDNGYVVAGHSSALGETGWLVRLSDRLGVDWFTALDGETVGGLTAVERREDALMVAGTSASAALAPQLLERSLVVAAVPYDGNFDVHPAFPHLQTPLMTAGVVDAFALEGPGGSVGALAISMSPGVATWSDEDRLLISPTPHCALLMTATGHPSAGDAGCLAQPDLWPPMVTIQQPEPIDYAIHEVVTPVVDVVDEGEVSAVTLSLDGVAVGPEPLALVDLGPGEHTLVAVALDAAGNEGRDEVTFSVVGPEATGDTGEPTEPIEERGRGCGCQSQPFRGAASLAGLWLVLLLGRRRLSPSRSAPRR